MKPETMDSKEFEECLEKVQEEKRKREEYDRREKELRIKHADERRRRSSMERPKVELQRKKNSQTGQRCTCFF